MTRYVLVADSSLIYTFRNFPLLDFLPSAPKAAVPSAIYRFLRGNPPPLIQTGSCYRHHTQ